RRGVMTALDKLHVHLESSRNRSVLFHLTEEKWAAAAKRHRKLAKSLRVTIGWDGDIIDDALRTADVMINSNPPRDKLRQRAPRWQQIFSTPIQGKTAVVIGFGDLGQGAGRAAKKLGMQVIAVTRSGKPARPADVIYRVSRIERALPKGDFVIVTTPLTAE